MENRSHALLAGLFIIAFVAATLAVVWWFSGARDTIEIYLLETRGNVTGLNLEGQVRYRGIRAGKVRDIRPDEKDPGLLLVEIGLRHPYRLTDRTVARLNYQGMTGQAYVMLDEGAEGAGTLLNTSGPQPPRIRIQPGLVEKLGDRAGEIASQLAETTARLNRLLDERNLQNVARTLDNVATASESMKELPRIMAALRTALAPDNLQRLNNVIAHLEKTTGAAAPLTAELRTLVASLNGLAQQLHTVGERVNADTLPRAEALLGEVSSATRRLDRLLETLNEAPQSILFGAPPLPPGPGEVGFVPPVSPAGSAGR